MLDALQNPAAAPRKERKCGSYSGSCLHDFSCTHPKCFSLPTQARYCLVLGFQLRQASDCRSSLDAFVSDRLGSSFSSRYFLFSLHHAVQVTAMPPALSCNCQHGGSLIPSPWQASAGGMHLQLVGSNAIPARISAYLVRWRERHLKERMSSLHPGHCTASSGFNACKFGSLFARSTWFSSNLRTLPSRWPFALDLLSKS